MSTVVGVAIPSWFAVLTAISATNVTFEWRYRAHPCTNYNLEFATVRQKVAVRHEFKLGSTSTLFTKSPLTEVRWNAQKALATDISGELFFFTMQEGLSRRVAKTPGLEDATVFLLYVFNTKLNRCSFFLYLNGRLFSVFTEGALSIIGKWEKKLIEELQVLVEGFGVEQELKNNVKKLHTKWNEVCHYLLATENNATDTYRVSYIPSSNKFMCSMSSQTPWRHEILFGQVPANDTQTFYTAQNGLHTTIGTKVRGHETRAVCTITFPNGMIALQEVSVVTTTPAPPKITTTSETRTPTTLANEPSESVRPSEGAGDRETITPGISEASASDADSTAAVVVVILVSISVVAVGLFALRRRVLASGSKFMRISAGS